MNDEEKAFYRAIGKRIKYQRQLYNLNRSGRDKITQERLAELANVSTSTVGNLESEKIVQGVSPDTLWKISSVLGISIERLYEDKDSKDSAAQTLRCYF